MKVMGILFTASNRLTERMKEASGKWKMYEKKMLQGKIISNLLLAHRHNSIFNGIVNAFSFKGCLCILSSLITPVHNVPEETP